MTLLHANTAEDAINGRRPNSDLPAPALNGVLVLLVTDLEGFTNVVERLGDLAARAVMQDHNRLLRHHIQQRNGVEVTHTGDGIIAAFRSVGCAFRCGQDIQRDLRSHSSMRPSLRARIGLHAGEPLSDDGRLFGSCVIVAARVCRLAEAQHILVTDVVRQLAHGSAFDFLARSVVRLKGFDHDIGVHELRLSELATPHHDVQAIVRTV